MAVRARTGTRAGLVQRLQAATAPMAKANPAMASGSLRYANAGSVRSVMCPSESVYAFGSWRKADAMSPGAATPRTIQRMAAMAAAASVDATATALVPYFRSGPPPAMADPNSSAMAG